MFWSSCADANRIKTAPEKQTGALAFEAAIEAGENPALCPQL